MRNILNHTLIACAAALAMTIVTGCQTDSSTTASTTASTSAQPAPAVGTPAPAAAAPAAPAATTATAAAPTTQGVIRIKAGVSAPFKDSAGNVWQADQGFDGGDVIERDASTAIANTKDAGLYLAEHYGMSSFSIPVANGKYIAHLHFAETFEGVTAAGQRVFSFSVMGHDFKDFDVFVKAGGSNRAYIETVPVEVTNGKFTITFTSNVENPEINAIELVPQS